MPYYKNIRDITPREKRIRTLDGLGRLREQLDNEMPRKTRNATLILGTWNIRNFDDNRFANGPRTAEDLHYIAEIISHFDVLAVQEICEDLSPLEKLMGFIGRDYDYIATDITEGKAGNKERLGYIYDRSKVSFKGIAGELVLPESYQIISGEKKLQFARTPFMCSFQAGWFKFLLSTVHIYFGKDKGIKYENRVSEIDGVARFIARRAKNDDNNHILVGDFNILKPGSRGFNALEKHGFKIFQNRKGSNKDQTKYYDQISFRVRENELRLADAENNRGVFQFFNSVYREEDFGKYRQDVAGAVRLKIRSLEEGIAEKTAKMSASNSEKVKEKEKKSIEKARRDIEKWNECLAEDAKLKGYYLGEWRTYHVSDHLALWVELEIDFSDAYLQFLATL